MLHLSFRAKWSEYLSMINNLVLYLIPKHRRDSCESDMDYSKILILGCQKKILPQAHLCV